MRKTMWVVALLLLVTSVALAQQPTTGTMVVRVADTDGKPLPGATVTATGPLGQQAQTSNAAGEADFRFLPPGTYALRIEMAGYAPMAFSRVSVTTGQTTRVPVKLQPGATEEVTVTSATPLVDAKRSEVVSNFKTENTIQTMPVGRNFADAVAFAPGVVSGLGTGAGNYSIGGASGLENSYIIDGVNITDSGYGGVGSYSIVYGSLGTGITTDFLEEVQVKTAGFEAEYGQALGGVVTGVVKSGTNNLSGAIRLYATPGSAEASGKDVVLPTGAANIKENEEFDLGLQLGGAIIQDKLFWFGAYNPVRSSDVTTIQDLGNPIATQLGGGADYGFSYAFPGAKSSGRETERTRNNYAAKLNFLATPNHRFELTAFGDPSDGDGRTGISASTLFLYADTNRDGVPDLTGSKTPAGFANGGRRSTIDYGADQQSLKYNGLFGANFFLEAQVNHRQNEFTEKSTVNDWQYTDSRITREWQFGGTIPAPVVPTAGGAGFIGPSRDETYDYALKGTWNVGNHELKAGMQYFDLEYEQESIYSGPTIDFPLPRLGGGAPVIATSTSGALVTIRNGLSDCPDCAFISGLTDYRVTRARFSPASGPVQGKEMAFFVQDNWSIGDKWNVKLGLRTSSQKLSGSGQFTLPWSVVATSAGNRFTDDPTTYNPRSHKFDMEISPRLGVSFDPKGDGKSKLFASAARYFQRIPADLAVRQFSNEVGTSRFTFSDPNLTTRSSSTVFLQGVASGEVAPGTKLPYVDEYVLGWQTLLSSDLSVEVRGIYRDQGRVLEDVQNTTVEAIQNFYYGGSGDYGNDFNGDGTIQDSELPFPGYGYGTFGAYVLANPGENTTGPFGAPVREYKAVEFQLIKRLKNNWQLTANYRYSRLRGNYEGLFRNDNGQSDPNITSLFDFPNSGLMRGQYQSGPLNTDRPHVLNVLGTYFFDNGFEAGGAFRWQSGVPRTALLAHPNYQNSGELPGQNPLYIDQIFDEFGNPTAWTLTPGTQDNEFQNIHGFTFLGNYTDAARGSLGRTPDFAAVDLHLGWQKKISATNLKITFDVFNLFNSQEPQSLDDTVETTATVLNPNYNRINGYQARRSMRLAAIWDF